MHRTVTIAIPSLPPVQALLSRVTGAVEAALMPDRDGEASRLLAALSLEESGGALDMGRLPLPIHDRLLAEVYRAELGETADCRARCGACNDAFEFSLNLSDVMAMQDAAATEVGMANEGGWGFGQWQVQVPLLGKVTLAALCDPPPVNDAETSEVEAFLERAAPLLSFDLDAVCPHCGDQQKLNFDLPRFLLTALANEAPFLIRETHLIASRYGWSHGEILALPRDQRRAFAGLIESERSASLHQRRAG